jgi:hypothetical protein
MEPGGSLPCSKEPSTGPYPEPDQSNPYHPILNNCLLFFSLGVRLSPLVTAVTVWPIVPAPDDR